MIDLQLTKCKKCDSKNLYLEPRVKGQDVLTANMVALKCKDCGTWLKWCPKDERRFYLNKKQDNKVEECWVIQRDDGKIFAGLNSKETAVFCYDFEFDYSDYVYTKKECENIIKFYNLQNCRPVKVEIRVAGE